MTKFEGREPSYLKLITCHSEDVKNESAWAVGHQQLLLRALPSQDKAQQHETAEAPRVIEIRQVQIQSTRLKVLPKFICIAVLCHECGTEVATETVLIMHNCIGLLLYFRNRP